MAKSAQAKKPTGSETTDAPAMKVAVQDFGPIAKGEVDLRPLTVFAGPSNTGKSWMATLIYILEQFSRFPADGYLFRHSGPINIKSHLAQFENPLAKSFDHKIPENLQDWIDATKKSTCNIALTREEIEAVRDTAHDAAEGIIPELERYYGVSEISQLIKNRGDNNLLIKFNIGKINYNLNHPLMPDKSSSNKIKKHLLQVNLPKKIELVGHEVLTGLLDEYRMNAAVYGHGDGNSEHENMALTRLRDSSCRTIIDGLRSASTASYWNRAYYLPADRGGIMHSHSVVVSALIRRASHAGLRQDPPLPALSGVLGDFLEDLLMTAEHKNPNEETLSASLEDKILRGKVILRKSESGYPNFEYQPKNWKDQLPLMTASSMVSELSPVVLFLKYLVKPGDTLILEEPEAHLHPASQKRLMEEIAGWTHSGIKVILTTHSDWILEGLSNIVARGEASEKKEQVSLNKKDVGVWIFDYIDPDDFDKGSGIREAAWNRDDGGYEAGFYDVAVNMHNDWANAINTLNNQDADK